MALEVALIWPAMLSLHQHQQQKLMENKTALSQRIQID
jgi:hypothetical protein